MLIVLAENQADVFQAIRKGFNTPNFGLVSMLLTVFLVAFIVTIIVSFLIRQRHEKRETLNDPRLLFDELVSAHELPPVQRDLLCRLADLSRIPRADQLFVRQDIFDAAAADLQQQDPAIQPEVDRLRDSLFSMPTT